MDPHPLVLVDGQGVEMVGICIMALRQWVLAFTRHHCLSACNTAQGSVGLAVSGCYTSFVKLRNIHAYLPVASSHYSQSLLIQNVHYKSFLDMDFCVVVEMVIIMVYVNLQNKFRGSLMGGMGPQGPPISAPEVT